MNISSLFGPHSLERRFHKGGGGGAPAPAAAVPRAIPPVTERLSDFSSQSRDAKKKAAKRKGFKSTILAGETGSVQGGVVNSSVGQRTLLGG